MKSLLVSGLIKILQKLCRGELTFIAGKTRKNKSFAKLPSSAFATPLHSHKYMETVFVLEGKPTLWLTQKEKLILPQGGYYWILPGTPHAESFSDYRSPYKLLWGIITLSGVNFFISRYIPERGFSLAHSNQRAFGIDSQDHGFDTQPLFKKEVHDISAGMKRHIFFETEYTAYIYQKVNSLNQITGIKKLTDLINENKNYTPSNFLFSDITDIQAYLIHILNTAIKKLHLNTNYKTDTQSYHKLLVSQIEEYINAHYQSDISLSALSSIVYCSPNHLNAVFKKIKGIPIHKFIMEKRLKKAIDLLNNSESLLIKEIAEMCGFQDPLYFSRMFKKYYGISPNQYNKNRVNH